MPTKWISDEERLSSWADAARASEDKTAKRLTTYEMSMAGLGTRGGNLSPGDKSCSYNGYSRKLLSQLGMLVRWTTETRRRCQWEA